MAEQVWAIVLAGGQGRRFGRLKQLELAGGRRLVDRTIDAARASCDQVAVVLPAGVQLPSGRADVICVGGEQQADSLRAALHVIPQTATIGVVCDPAHPLATPALFGAVIDAVRAGADGAVPTVPVLEVIQRVVDGVVVETVPKTGLRITQSPQAFRMEALRSVHADDPYPVENSGLLVERGYRVVTVEGDPLNLHVSTERELAMVDRLSGMAES